MNTTIEEQPAVEHSQSELESGVIELVISETDRQTASRYTDVHNCLICTALKNRGINVDDAGPAFVDLTGRGYWGIEDSMGAPESLYSDPYAVAAPFYGPFVVGKVIKLRRVERQ